MYNIAIVEDEVENREQIRDFIEQYSREKNVPVSTRLFEDAPSLLQVIRGKAGADSQVFDIIFFDIDMPVLNGMEAAELVRKVDENVVIVFITNLKHYAIQGYSVGALDYVLKPIDYYSFSLRMARAIERVKKKQTTEILLPVGERMIRLDSAEIYYIESANRMLNYHTEKGTFEVRGTMKSCEEELADYHFVKCNHWYLVNLKHVSAINQNTVTVAGYELEISRRNKSAFTKAVTDYIAGGL